MTKGSRNKQEIFLSVLMLGIGIGFAVMAFTGIPALLPTGVFYAWIGLRGLRARLAQAADLAGDTSHGDPARARLR
ncbi:MAG: hypothetical protein HKO64_10525 [Xanthomonadales bacterium]|nr:hypothetical protein [Xanthomonadales bacterium]NNL96043.1 hypothetical protein [Xanthomonadales bacterium]